MSDKRDLLIHYDEESQKFIFYMLEAADTAALRAKAFDGVCPEVAFFKEKSPDDAEKAMGGMVFAALDHGSINRVNIRDYKAESEEATKEYVLELEVAAQNNDPDAQFCLFIEYHHRAINSGNPRDLLRAEELLCASAKSGFADAQKALEDWPLMKAAAERRIQRGPSV
jgi:TPR repeat protein